VEYKNEEEDDALEAQPLTPKLWEAPLLQNFKIHNLLSLDGKTNPLAKLMAMGTQTSIIGASEPLKYKLPSGMFKDVALHWYMHLPNHSITWYVDFYKNFIHQFSKIKHVQVTATSLFSIRQGHSEALHEFFARFIQVTIKVSNPYKEMSMAAFQNGLKVGHFNESLAPKPATSI
jgi:hypothetical protein